MRVMTCVLGADWLALIHKEDCLTGQVGSVQAGLSAVTFSRGLSCLSGTVSSRLSSFPALMALHLSLRL